MRTSRKKPLKPAHTSKAQDEAFSRLYKTIPAGRYADMDDPGLQVPQGKARGAEKNLQKSKPRWKRIVKRVLLIIVAIALLAGLWLGWKFISNGVKLFGWGGLIDLFRTTKLKGEDEGGVNILLAGNSADDPGHAGGDLTDSIMIVHIDPEQKKGYMLSVPRDLYIDIPDHGYAKVNEAYQDGERSAFSEPGYAPGGMGLLQKTIAENFGLTFHYYGLVNYTALQQAVDAVGGIKVTITSSDPRGLYDPSPDLQRGRQPLVDLPNGEVSLDGRQALNLARARGNARGSYGYGLSDFTRTDNQRKILLGLKEKATGMSTLSNPIKLGELLDSAGNNIKTDFRPGELRRLHQLTKDIPDDRIKSVGLNAADGQNLLMSYRTRSGQSALVPKAGLDDYSAIQAFIRGL